MKLIASDYDGTLRRPQDGITNADREAIKRWRAAGNLFGVVTGRGPGMDRELGRENVEYDFIIDFNGANIWNNKGELLKQTVGNGEKLYDSLSSMLRKDGDWADIITRTRSYFVTYEDKFVEERDTWVKNEEIKNVEEFMQIYALCKNEEDSLQISAELNEKYSDYMSPLVNGSWLNIAPTNVTKSYGIREYAKLVEVEEKDIFTIGDSYNDLDMIKAFTGFSVLNGAEEIKAAASKVCDGISGLIAELM